MRKSRGVLGWIGGVVLMLAGGGCVDEPGIGRQSSELSGSAVVAEGDHDAVGIVVIDGRLCTGTLVSDTIVLTAAHCVCPEAQTCTRPDGGTFRLTTVPVRATNLVPAHIGDKTFRIAGMYVHPDYEVGVTQQNDVAVLELVPKEPVSKWVDVVPLPLATTVPSPRDEGTIVSYGPSSDCVVDDRVKRAGDVTVDHVDYPGGGDITVFLDFGSLVPCRGDSGAPTLVGPRSEVATVLSSPDAGKAVAAYLPWIGLQTLSPGNHVAAFDLAGGGPADSSQYLDDLMDSLLGWLDAGDVQLTGDFMGTGSDQILYLNRGGSLGQLRIASYADREAPSESMYWRNWGGAPSAFDAFVQPNDRLYVGDFRNVGHDQLLMLNQGGGLTQPLLQVMNFSAGYAQTWYASTYANEPLVGWHDIPDSLVVGDFRNLGYDQVMLINRAGTDGRIVILDLSDGQYPGEWIYFEHHSDGVQLNGWTDPDDLAIAGDFRGLGYDQVMFVNRGGGTGRVIVADFSDGAFPAEWQYYEAYGGSTLLDGYHDSPVDVAVAGDFRGLGYDQVAFVNRNAPWFNRVLVADFLDGIAPATATFVQTQLQSSRLLPRIDATDVVLAGDIATAGRDALVTIEP